MTYQLISGQEVTRPQYLKWQVGEVLQRTLPEHFRDKRFSDLKGDIYPPIIEKLKEWDFENPTVCSFLSKQNGIGKTHLAISLYKKYLYDFYEQHFENNITEVLVGEEGGSSLMWEKDLKPIHPKCLFLSEKKLILQVQESYKEGAMSEKEIMDDYCSYNILVIDDMFASRDNDFARRIIFYIVDERSEWLKTPTIITSNFTIQEIHNIDSRISSRIDNSMRFQIDSQQKDYRRLK